MENQAQSSTPLEKKGFKFPKILLVFPLLVLIILGIEGFFYWQYQKERSLEKETVAEVARKPVEPLKKGQPNWEEEYFNQPVEVVSLDYENRKLEINYLAKDGSLKSKEFSLAEDVKIMVSPGEAPDKINLNDLGSRVEIIPVVGDPTLIKTIIIGSN